LAKSRNADLHYSSRRTGNEYDFFGFFAIIYHKLDKASEARQALKQAERLVEKKPARFWADQWKRSYSGFRTTQ